MRFWLRVKYTIQNPVFARPEVCLPAGLVQIPDENGGIKSGVALIGLPENGMTYVIHKIAR
jgi:hypothetical protein